MADLIKDIDGGVLEGVRIHLVRNITCKVTAVSKHVSAIGM